MRVNTHHARTVSGEEKVNDTQECQMYMYLLRNKVAAVLVVKAADGIRTGLEVVWEWW